MAEGGAEGDPFGRDRVGLRTEGTAAAEAGVVAEGAGTPPGSERGRSGWERLKLMRLFEKLRGLGYSGGYDAVRRYAARWRPQQSATTTAFVPLSFAPR
jgi:hypothetical protein